MSGRIPGEAVPDENINQCLAGPPPTLDEVWQRLNDEAARNLTNLLVAEARIEGFLLYQNTMPPPAEPEQVIQPKTLSEALGTLDSTPIPPGSKLPPSALLTEVCPNCKSSNFFPLSEDRASQCFNCGWTPRFWQDPEAPAAPPVNHNVEQDAPTTTPPRPAEAPRTSRRRRLRGKKSWS